MSDDECNTFVAGCGITISNGCQFRDGVYAVVHGVEYRLESADFRKRCDDCSFNKSTGCTSPLMLKGICDVAPGYNWKLSNPYYAGFEGNPDISLNYEQDFCGERCISSDGGYLG